MGSKSAALLLAAVLACGNAAAETPPPLASLGQPAAARGAQGSARNVPPPDVLVMLIRTTLISLNQANATGNYSVLHGLAGPELSTTSTPESLAQALSPFRAKRIDLSPVAVVSPILDQPPSLGPDGLLRLAGVFPTKPFAVRFNLSFSLSAQGWRMEGLNVDATPAPAGAKPRPKVDFEVGSFLPQRKPAKPRQAPRPSASAPVLDHSTDPPTTTNY